jgi:homopolymeric O-antigen transport system permease protein
MSIDITYIKPKKGWQVIGFKELKEYSDLFYFLVSRNIKVMYAQTVLGFSWAILQPLVQIVIFSVVFGRVAKIPTDGIPYPLFSSVAIIPWTYMQSAMSSSSDSLVQGQGMLGKIYFPRLIFPLSPILSRMVDFGISIVIVFGVMVYYHVTPTWNLVLFPVFVLFMMILPAGVGMWLSAVAIRYRDVRYAMPFILKMLIYSAPILYTASSIPSSYRLIYSLNPIVGVVEGFRATLLGLPIPWDLIGLGMITALILLISGALYFKRMERFFVDVI